MRTNRLTHRERGAALLVSLIVLLALTLLAVSGMQSSIFQERMTSSQREGMDALQLAERALSDVEDMVRPGHNAIDWGANGFYERDDFPDSIFELTASRNGCELSSSRVGTWERNSDVRGCAWYIVEELTPVFLDSEGFLDPEVAQGGGAMVRRARITVLAVGPSEESRRAVEALFFYQ